MQDTQLQAHFLPVGHTLLVSLLTSSLDMRSVETPVFPLQSPWWAVRSYTVELSLLSYASREISSSTTRVPSHSELMRIALEDFNPLCVTSNKGVRERKRFAASEKRDRLFLQPFIIARQPASTPPILSVTHTTLSILDVPLRNEPPILCNKGHGAAGHPPDPH